ncbi:MAG TPA: type II secretion system F family protein [Verrucomicrobiae bacterium]|jgi:type II secretory pathway component PulF|nr:type II secretion system F family protein [Verrucomicrobiae bacterium]
MKHDEFAFCNQQLAAMLREGLPLEGSLRQLCANMRRGKLRSELQLLEADLAKGTPLNDGLAARNLPEFYVHMMKVGVAGNDLPGMLVMLADHYQRVNLVWTRLKGLMVYPLLVLVTTFLVSAFISFIFVSVFSGSDMRNLTAFSPGPTGAPSVPLGLFVNFWAPPICLGLLLFLAVLILAVPRLRRELRWRLPAFKEANLAQLAGAMWLALKSGGNLGDALVLMRDLEKDNKAGRELSKWHDRLAQGRGKFSELARPGSIFPPLFIWLVTNSGEDLAAGFERAAEIYGARATHRIEMFLYAALPFSVVALGSMVVCQALTMAGFLGNMMQWLSLL